MIADITLLRKDGVERFHHWEGEIRILPLKSARCPYGHGFKCWSRISKENRTPALRETNAN